MVRISLEPPLTTLLTFACALVSCVEDPNVTALWPSSAPELGDAVITVTGSLFLAPTTWCKFGTVSVQATVQSSSVLRCVAPAAAPSDVAVEISNNAVDYTNNNVRFTYNPAVDFHLMVPSSGPNVGGTVVTVTGSEYLSNATCKFGTLWAMSQTVVSSSVIECTTPAQATSVVSVEITNNAQDFTLLTRRFVYYSTNFIVSMCT